MTTKNIILVTFSLFLNLSLVQAQNDSIPEDNTWTLEQCINYSMENNITVKRQMLNVDVQENELSQSKRNRLPDLSANISGGYSYGLTWVQQQGENIESNNTKVEPRLTTNIPIYQGMAINNTIKRNKYNLLSSIEASNKTKNDITIQITSQFLQILFNKELLAVAEEQYKTSQLQVERTTKLVEAGSVAQGNLLEIKSQASKEALNVTQQENNLMVSLLDLAQLLDLEQAVDFDILAPNIPEMGNFEPELPRAIYNKAVQVMPEIKKAEYDLNGSEYDVKIAKGALQPSLGIGATFRSASTWILDDGHPNRNFKDQLKSNQNTYIGASLSIPIFGKLQTRTQVANAKINMLDAQYRLKSAKLDLMKEIQQAYVDAAASFKNYLASKEAVESYQESFRYTEQRFNVGLVNSVDYNVAKTEFTRAQSNLLQAKYEYVLRTKILDFYKGIPITL